MPSSLSRSLGTANALAAAAAVGLLFAIGLATAPIATADTCDNATLRAQNNSTELPDCRAYEMVSPPFKAGFPVRMDSVADTDDGIVSFTSTGAFAGTPQNHLLQSPYRAERSSAGWVTTAPSPPAATWNEETSQFTFLQSADLRESLWTRSRRDVPGDVLGYWLKGADGAYTRVGDARPSNGSIGGAVPSTAQWVSDDLSHVVYQFGTAGSAPSTALWEHVGTGNGSPRAVSVDNQGQPPTDDTCFRNLSRDGRVIVFSLGGGCDQGLQTLRARLGGSVTVAVSGSECTRTAGDLGGVCNAAAPMSYAGAADDGSRVFFTTTQQLVNDDIDQANDLYACEIPDGVPAPVGAANPCASLTQVSGTSTNAQVENVVAVSDDGSRVYFVAQGVLAGNLGVGDVGASAGAHNLYLWERDGAGPTGETRFVAESSVNEATPEGRGGAQMTPDGRYLQFTTSNSLVSTGPDADIDGATDVYRYDADTPAIVRVSTSVAGGGGNGGFDAFTSQRPAMTSDGSTVVFSTAEALSASDVNGADDVYAWHDGHVSRISPDGVVAPAGGQDYTTVTPSGRDILFTTNARVLAADGDATTDIYTARVGGGFAPPPPPPGCSGDPCQGPVSAAPGVAGPRSGPSGGGNPKQAAAKLSLRGVSAAQRRRLAATGKLSLTVRADAAGRLSATARAKIGKRSVTVASARRTITKPGSVALTLKLSRKARRQLAARGKLTVKVSVSHSRASKGRSVTVKLTRAKSSTGGRS